MDFSFSIDPSAWTLIWTSFVTGYFLRSVTTWWLPGWVFKGMARWRDRLERLERTS